VCAQLGPGSSACSLSVVDSCSPTTLTYSPSSIAPEPSWGGYALSYATRLCHRRAGRLHTFD
jgi:hypothetical protein